MVKIKRFMVGTLVAGMLIGGTVNATETGVCKSSPTEKVLESNGTVGQEKPQRYNFATETGVGKSKPSGTEGHAPNRITGTNTGVGKSKPSGTEGHAPNRAIRRINTASSNTLSGSVTSSNNDVGDD